MDENKLNPEAGTGTPGAPVPTPQAPMPTPEAAPAAQAAPAPVETPSVPLTPPQAPGPEQAGYQAQYAAQPVPTGAPAPGAPLPTAPVSPTPALVCGILSIVFCSIPIVGIILGIIAIVQAGKYIKAGGTEGTAKGGKICGIIGIVFSCLMIILSCVLIAIGLAALNSSENYTSSSTTSTVNAGSSSTMVEGDEEQAIYDAVDPYLEQIKNKDPEMVASIAAMMEDSFNDSLSELDVTLTKCGVDPQQLAAAMMEGFDYDTYYASVDGATAEANYLVTVRDATEIGSAFYDRIIELLSEEDAGTMAEDEIYQLIGQELMSAVQSATPVENNIWDVDLSNDTGSWVMDSESWDEEIEYFFMLR